MKRMGRAVTVLVVILLMANILMGGDAQAMVAAGRARCVAEGLPEELLVGDYHCKGGAFGFGGHVVVESQVRDTEPRRVFRVELQRWVNVLGWQPVAFTELPRGDEK
jgi:hypothetical protein